jgi:hypothetical protein
MTLHVCYTPIIPSQLYNSGNLNLHDIMFHHEVCTNNNIVTILYLFMIDALQVYYNYPIKTII